ncbi:leucine-rich repeat-containing protein 58 [Drosophila subpulchrella]|uniref:leucine-rich repeat-containing protein 58 n=1 Tax=Drosophila subpulchrella TaxID=1486046 RepID=UPI0018A15AD7|nr:leucine-rich repeat-containing protein 58 [Drosophila subpulchrella]
MKILCEVQVVNRTTQANRTPRPVKSTLAIGYKQSARDSNGNTKKELEMVLFSGQNKTGHRYKVKDNIHAVHTKFVLDGKATIGFLQPAENLLIKCDPIQLKGFLQTLKLGMDGKDAINLRLNIASATAIPQKAQPQVRMVVSKRSEYPIKGFPRTLKSLTINNSQLVKLSFEVCSLRNLTKLDVSGNKLTKIPSELGRLALTSLNLSSNSLGELNDWCWLRGTKLRQTLGELDLSSNGLTYFPPPLVKFESLVSLNLNHNQISRLPFGIRRLQALRKLYVCSNKLESLPAAIEDLHVDLLDVWGNCFKSFNAEADQQLSRQKATANSPHPLWLQAARAVDNYKLPLPAGSVPAILIELICEAPKCLCGKLCYALNKEDIFQRVTMPKFTNIKNLTYSREHQIYADVVLCSPSCSVSVHRCIGIFSIKFP